MSKHTPTDDTTTPVIGDLPDRMADAMHAELSRTATTRGRMSLINLAPLAQAALSVRWEHAASQAAELKRLRTELVEAQKRIDWLRGHAEWLSSERDALKAAVVALAERWENALALDRPYARDLRAILAATES